MHLLKFFNNWSNSFIKILLATMILMTLLASRDPLIGTTYKVCPQTETKEGIYGHSDRKLDNL